MTAGPHNITVNFEAALCEYTGAKYAVAVNSCSMALLLACAYLRHRAFPMIITIPKRTYVSVPMSIMHAGHRVAFNDEDWQGAYELDWGNHLLLPRIFDSARRFTSSMYQPGQMQCVSFHASKILGDTQGGAILHDSDDADAWLRRARFDGRTQGVDPRYDTFDMIGHHAYMSPDVAARLLFKLSVLQAHNADLPNSDYPDLSTIKAFQ